MPCDHCPSTAVFSAMRVRFRPLSTRATIPAAAMSGWRSPSPRGLDPPGWIGARPKGLPARLRCVPRAREDPAGPWPRRPSCRLAAHPATEPSASSIRPAQRRPRICLSALDSIPVCSLRWVHRTDNVSVVILRRTTTRFSRKGESLAELSAFFLRPWHAGRTPGCARLARQINAKRALGVLRYGRRGKPLPFDTEGKGWSVGGGRRVVDQVFAARGAGAGQVLARIRGAARYGRRVKESPFPSKPKGRGLSIEPGRKDRPRATLRTYILLGSGFGQAAVNVGVVDQGAFRPDQHLDRNILR